VGKEWKRCFFLGKHDHQPWGLSRRWGLTMMVI
jgi:hypothetical protein